MKRIPKSFVVIAAAGMVTLVFSVSPPPGRGGAGQDAAVTILPTDSDLALIEKAARVVPSERQLAWQALEFQAFVHFGMNTFTDREWGEGTEDPALFNPTDLDADQWAGAFKAAGMKGVILTAKHHDGFCLWPSRQTRHSVAASPWKDGRGDVVREVAEASRRAGLKFGVYHSPWDRHEPSYGDSPRYNEHFKNQLRELLTGYGEVSEVWFDGACGEGPNGKRQVYDWDGYWSLIRELQPNAVISIMGPDVRWCGNEAGRTRESEWSIVPLARIEDRPDDKDPGGIAGLEAGAPDLGSLDRIREIAKGGGRLVWYPAQVNTSIRPGWFYHPAEDMKVKPLDHLLEVYYGSVGGNAQFLLNVPPDTRGRVHESDVRRLAEIGDALRAAFSINLASGARPEAVPVRSEPGFGPEMTLDGDARTHWTPGEGSADPSIVYDLGGDETFNVARLSENIRIGQRISAFALDVAEGSGWKEIIRGTTVGAQRLVRFPAVRASKVRLRIVDSRLAPAVAEFGLHLDPALVARRPDLTPIPDETPGLRDFVLDLNGNWKFAPDPPAGFWAKDVDVSAWENIQVPGEWAAQGWTLGQDIERVYRRSVEIPKNFGGRRLLLRFDGVYSYARVWVDGVYVRDHHGGFTSWDCDVTGLVTPGAAAVVTVGVTDMSDEISWGSSYAKHNIGGILQEVRLVALPATHAARLHVGTALDEDHQKGTLEVTAAGRFEENRTAEFRFALTDHWGRPVPMTPDRVLLGAGEPEKTVSIPVGPVATWDAEHPRLYRLEVRVLSSGRTLEVFRRDVGFREVEVRGNELLVNGRPVKLRGGNRHNVHPLRGRSITADLDERDARLFREANINFVRTSHYPPTESFLAACDKYGIYVEEENALCFVATHGNLPSSENPAFRSRYFGPFGEMVERDRSHPSVIIWSMGNESLWGDNVRRLYEYVKTEDPSRPVIWSYPDSVPKGTSGYDVFSHHYPKFDADMKSPEIPKLMDEWAHVACYNVETLKRDPGVRDFWGESLKKFWENAYTAEGCLGGAIWGLIDDVFFLPGGAAGYGEWGIIDGWRRPKPEYWHVKKAYSPVRIEDGPVPGVRAGEPIRVPVENWFDHTNLAETRIVWSIGPRGGKIEGPDVPPGGKGEIVVPDGNWRPGDVLKLNILAADGGIVDEFALPLGEQARPALEPGQGPAPSIGMDPDRITVAGDGFAVIFERRTGLIEKAERGGRTLLRGGPFPQAAPTPYMPWSLASLETEVRGNEAVLDIRGSCAGTLAAFVVRIDGRGLVTVDYDIKGKPAGASELGLAFDLPAETEEISWKRDGFHSVYPEGHIGRREGTARKTRAGQADAYRVLPLWPWTGDAADYFLFGKDHEGYGATRDFRSLRPNIHWTEFGYTGTAAKLRIESDGSQAVRAELLPGGGVRLNILDHWAYPDLDWGNFEGRTEFPAGPKGRVRIRLLR